MTLPDENERRPLARSAAHNDKSPDATLAPADANAWYSAGLRDGIEIGMRLEAAERDALWNEAARLVQAAALEAVDPDGPARRASAAARVRAAEAESRRQAREHWRAFLDEAAATPPSKRTDPQRGALRLVTEGRRAA